MIREGRKLLDVIRWGQDYVEGNGDKEKISKAVNGINDLYIPFIIENISRAIKENMEEAISYNPVNDIHRVYHLKDMTEEEYENNPIKIAHDEYAGAIKHRISDLDIPSVLEAITATKTLPSYKNATNKALRVAEKKLKKIFDETGSSINIAAFLTEGLIDRVCKISYDVYHREEFDAVDSYILEAMKQSEAIMNKISEPYSDPKNDRYYQERESLDREMNEKLTKYVDNIYKADQAGQITKEIISRLYPNQPMPESFIEKAVREIKAIPATSYPNSFVIPKDKVSNKLFNNELAEGMHLVATENRRSKKELTAKVSIDFNGLEGVAISKNITPYDREVHDAIVSLYVDGGNEHITPLMIYRTMTGNQRAELTPKQTEAVRNSVTKCSMARIRIDAEEEAEAHEMDKLIYEGNLIYTKIIEGTHKGETGEWIYIMERPVLYDYASSKNQIARAEINLLNTPINKNEETIILQGYLLKRILTMQNTKMSRNILYETIYKQLDVKAASAGALRKKQSKIRESAKRILDDWKEKKFIKGYKENKGARNATISLSILID